jgi:hypothetical protein
MAWVLKVHVRAKSLTVVEHVPLDLAKGEELGAYLQLINIRGVS